MMDRKGSKSQNVIPNALLPKNVNRFWIHWQVQTPQILLHRLRKTRHRPMNKLTYIVLVGQKKGKTKIYKTPTCFTFLCMTSGSPTMSQLPMLLRIRVTKD